MNVTLLCGSGCQGAHVELVMFWGEGLFVFPLMLVYTVISYSVFRGKAGAASHDHY